MNVQVKILLIFLYILPKDRIQRGWRQPQVLLWNTWSASFPADPIFSFCFLLFPLV